MHTPIPLQPVYTFREYTYRNSSFRADFALDLHPDKPPVISLRIISKADDEAITANTNPDVKVPTTPFVLIKHMPLPDYDMLAGLFPSSHAILALFETLSPQDLACTPVHNNAGSPVASTPV